jgi:CheY-like chemotaxis protein
MVYGFVKQTGGHVKIYSEIRHGTSVKIYLPRYAGMTAPLQRAAATPEDLMPGGSETVLVVEDDDLVRGSVVCQIKSLGYTVIEADTAATALDKLASAPKTRLLFTDVVLRGGMNGRTLAAEAQQRQPQLKVLFTSGYSENAIVHHGRLDPDIQLLSKPYRKADLARKLREALDS